MSPALVDRLVVDRPAGTRRLPADDVAGAQLGADPPPERAGTDVEHVLVPVAEEVDVAVLVGARDVLAP
jgi:hypothetical protein